MTETAESKSSTFTNIDGSGSNCIASYINTNDVSWQQSQFYGLKQKTLSIRSTNNSLRNTITSLTKLKPGSRLEQGSAASAKEILILDGTLNDECKQYSKGSYLRYPSKSNRSLYSEDGCIVLLTTNQFQYSDLLNFHINTHRTSLYHTHSPYHQSLCLHEHKSEAVYIHNYKAGASHRANYRYGLELYVLDGRIRSAGTTLGIGCWLRMPANTKASLLALEDCRLLIKEGHLTLGGC